VDAGEGLATSAAVLSENGNMSSATIFFVLQRLLATTARDDVFAAGFGPGLTVEYARLSRYTGVAAAATVTAGDGPTAAGEDGPVSEGRPGPVATSEGAWAAAAAGATTEAAAVTVAAAMTPGSGALVDAMALGVSGGGRVPRESDVAGALAEPTENPLADSEVRRRK
jgi:hypothetical protein